MKKILLSALAIMVLASCSTTQTLYSWYNYENISYQYSKKQTEELQVAVLKTYAKLSDRQEGTRKVVPPGLNAEYGYLLFKTGKKEEGLAYLKKEAQLYPESDKYISRIINQLER